MYAATNFPYFAINNLLLTPNHLNIAFSNSHIFILIFFWWRTFCYNESNEVQWLHLADDMTLFYAGFNAFISRCFNDAKLFLSLQWNCVEIRGEVRKKKPHRFIKFFKRNFFLKVIFFSSFISTMNNAQRSETFFLSFFLSRYLQTLFFLRAQHIEMDCLCVVENKKKEKIISFFLRNSMQKKKWIKKTCAKSALVS